MKTIINVECMDQELVITNSPVIASGGVHENFIAFNFCSKWDGFGKTAVFYRNEKERFYSVLGPDDVCEIPHEVTDYEGNMYFGVYGEAGEVTRTSKILKYKISKGAMTTLLKPSEEPTPDIYQQLLSAYGQTNEAIARETAERESSMMAEESARNSAINTAILAEENARKQADATEKTERQAEIAVERARINQLTRMEEGSTTGDVELMDIRVGADGQTHESAGEAVRSQYVDLNTKIDDFKKESGTEYVEEELVITMNTCYDVHTGIPKADASCFSTDIKPVYPGQRGIISLYSGQYLATVAMFDENGAYKGRLYDAGVDFYYWEDKEITIPKGVYGISLSAFKKDGYETKLLLEKNFRGVIEETVGILSPEIEKNAEIIDTLTDYVGYVDTDVAYKNFDAGNTSTFENISDTHVVINVVNPKADGYVVGIECRPTETMIADNNDKKLLIDVNCDYDGMIDCYVYGGKGIVSVLHDTTGKFAIDLANLEVYHSGFKYAIVGITNPTVNRIEMEVSVSLDQLRLNEYYGGNVINTVNNVSNTLSSYMAENSSNKYPYLTSPNGTMFKLRVDNNGNLVASSISKTIGSALFCGNSLLVSNGGSGMCASSPEKDYFSLVCSFLKSRNDAFVYHVWNDEIDGTETAIKADNFAGVFENLTTVEGVEKFLPTMDKYFANYTPDYISIQLGDNSAQNVDFFTGKALPMLFDYLQTKAPNSLIVCMGAWYTTQGLLSGIAKTCADYDIIFVNFSGCKRTETCNTVGATVVYPDRTEHTVTNSGVASHPNDKGFAEIANLVIEAIDPYVISVN